MVLFDRLFKARKLPDRWIRFTASYPWVGNIIAIAGLAWISYSLAIIIIAANKHGHGAFIETLGTVSNSRNLVDYALYIRTTYQHLFPADVRELVANLYGNLALYLVVPFLLCLEYFFPANPSQPLISKGILQDSIWYLFFTPVNLLILYPVGQFLHGLFSQYLGFLIVSDATNWSVYLQVTAALFLGEFFAWFNHFVRHKIRSLWFFHAIHHSQKELNVFTDDRGHFIDLLVGSLVMFVPFFVFQVSNFYAVTIIALYKPIHNRFIHSNIKVNLGWLGFLFTSPQFHRVHHSMEQDHVDKNFGVHFSIYDQLFGTAFPSINVYPATGIEDPFFPSEEKVRIRHLPGNWLRQTVYPFKQLALQIQASRIFQMKNRQINPRNDSQQNKFS